MIEMSAAEFIAYITRYKIAPKENAEKYTAENPKEVYHYEDIDTVYQEFIKQITTKRTVYSYSSITGKGLHDMGGGCSRTINGIKYGGSYD